MGFSYNNVWCFQSLVEVILFNGVLTETALGDPPSYASDFIASIPSHPGAINLFLALYRAMESNNSQVLGIDII